MAPAPRRLRQLPALFREPLVHFAALGAALFGLHAAVAAPARDDKVVVGADFVAGLRQEHAARTGKPPSPEEERELVDRFVDEEVLYREAVALGLDRGDPIVRRRLAQKVTFLAEDAAAAREPKEAELRAYLAAHTDRYGLPGRLSFRHVLFGRDRRPDAVAEAERALAALRGGATPDGLGDPFLQGASFVRRSTGEIEATFGSAFAQAIAKAPDGAWTGPLPSSFGVHLVKVEERTPGVPPALDAVRARVRQDLLDERKAEAVRALRARLRARYAVTIEGRGADAGGGR